MGLFDRQEADNLAAAQPLAARMRPRTLEEFVGQEHFLGEGRLLRRMLQAGRIGSVIFYGPPGTGKTSLAELVARHVRAKFVRLNAAASGVKELRAELDRARNNLETGGTQTVLFIDELHRFNRSQQDVLLPDVEAGIVSLIGATTANPFFSLVAPLVSRSQIFEFRSLSTESVRDLISRTVHDSDRGLGKRRVSISEDALAFLAEICEGDARRALTALEIAALSLAEGEEITLQVAEESIQRKALQYDGTGDEHYDIASAFIKSIRGGDPDAAVYWMARMLESGEDPRFIARRIVIAASEDIGNADPQGLVLANAAAQATEFVGLPECRIILTQAVTYLAMAPKSNAAIKAINAAQTDVREKRILPVPNHLRDKHYSGAKRLDRGKGYQYPHDANEGWLPQDYLGVDREFYQPVDRGCEKEIATRLADWRERRRQARNDTPPDDA